ncbi:hypothetical protein CEP54_016038 [Fusarium duplospermum]|uniref:Uncharacterized protein n=1 Tax=Fusarium duplospermum TaxID=1325734 RepID=A0A428NJ58_9HYPO|nr:hypothetical protein CEP54_016038 [Fusarium duplospermum]
MGSISQKNEFDVIIIGAGVSGCRFDSESFSYAFSFHKELLNEWYWKEAFSAQPDTLRYLKRFAEKHKLYSYIQPNTIAKSARWDGHQSWTLEDDAVTTYTTNILTSCIRFLSASTFLAIPGLDRWHPLSYVSLIITALSKEPSIKSIEVFQGRANWASPLRNSDFSTGQMAETIQSGHYDSVFDTCARSTSSFMHPPDPRKSSEVSQERVELWERLYNPPANKIYSDFKANKIRQRVSDPVLAEKLIPKDHSFGTLCVPLESGYYEAYHKSHVRLTDLKETPIESITASDIETFR